MDNDKEFPEAKGIAFTSWKRPDGFIVNFTVRDTDGEKTYARIDAVIKKALKDNCTPYERQSFSKFPPKQAKPIEYVIGRMCPTCGKQLVYGNTKDGKRFIKCITNKYNFATKQAEGCPYVEWNVPTQASLSATDKKTEDAIDDWQA